jgi:serine/threonine-protein kinase HipA
MAGEQVSALRLTLHGQLVGYVAGYAHNRTVLSLAPSFVANANRPALTLSLANPATFTARAGKIFPVATNMQLHPLLSNLLPEGALRQLLAQRLKIHEHNEFPLLVHLGGDLPGARVA